MEAYNLSDGQWEPVVKLATMLIEELKGKLKRSPNTPPQSQEAVREGEVGMVGDSLAGTAHGLKIEVADISDGKGRCDSGVELGGPQT